MIINVYRVQEDMIPAENGTFLFVENEGHTMRQMAKRQVISKSKVATMRQLAHLKN